MPDEPADFNPADFNPADFDPADFDPADVRTDVALDAPVWVMYPEPRMTHPTLSDDEYIAQMRAEIDFDLLDDLLALTVAERIDRHESARALVAALRSARPVRA